MTIRILLFLTILVLGGCSSSTPDTTDGLPDYIKELENLTVHPADARPDASITLMQDTIFQSTKDNFMLIGGSDGNIVEIDEAGRVYIPDRRQNTIHVLGSDGSYIRRLGREGRGPGEFENNGGIRPQIKEGKLYVRDTILNRISVFDLESMSFSHTIVLNSKNWSGIDELSAAAVRNYYVQSDSTILLRSAFKMDKMDPYTYYCFNINHEGGRVSDIILQQVGPDVIPMQIQHFQAYSTNATFQEEPLLATTNDGRIVAANTKEFLIKLYQPDGEAIGAIYYQIEKQPLSRSDALDTVDPQITVSSSSEFPEFWPVLHSNMVVDGENRLWVSTLTEDQEVYQWWVLDLDQSGKLLARFEWPRSEYIEVVKDGYLYTREQAPETAVSKVMRYSVEIKER